MKSISNFVPLLLAISLIIVISVAKNTPEQIFLSLTGRPYPSTHSHTVTWTTGSSTKQTNGLYSTPNSILIYGVSPQALTNTVTGTSKQIAKDGYQADIHIADFGPLPKGMIYYQVGDPSVKNGLSPVYSFTSTPVKRYAVYGDYGDSGLSFSYSTLAKAVTDGLFQSVFHIGDIAYDLDKKSGAVGDSFLRHMEPIGSRVPMQFVPGNHEKAANFTHYKHRFRAQRRAGDYSGSNTQFYYSLEQELAHMVFFDTEVYLTDDNQDQQRHQLNWLEQDLKRANLPENRKLRPWIIAFAHKCDWHEGVDYSRFSVLLNTYGVDLVVCGHQHNYQRLFPSHGAQEIESNQDTHTYINPGHLVQIVVGSPGVDSGIGSHVCPYPRALAHNLFTYGFGMFQILNSTHLTWDFIETATPTKTAEEDDFFGHAVMALERGSAHLSVEERLKMANNEMLLELHRKHNNNIPLELAPGSSIQDHMVLIQTRHAPRSAISAHDARKRNDFVEHYNNWIEPNQKAQLSLNARLYPELHQNAALLAYIENRSRSGTRNQNSQGGDDDQDLIAALQQRIKQTQALIKLFDTHSYFNQISSEAALAASAAQTNDTFGCAKEAGLVEQWDLVDPIDGRVVQYTAVQRPNPKRPRY